MRAYVRPNFQIRIYIKTYILKRKDSGFGKNKKYEFYIKKHDLDQMGPKNDIGP